MSVRFLTSLLIAISLLAAETTLTSCASSSSTRQSDRQGRLLNALPQNGLNSIDAAYQRMLDAGISKPFADQIKTSYLKQDEERSKRENIIYLNIFGFLAHGDYSLHYSKRALNSTRTFLKKYDKTLRLAEKRYQVSKETIAALIWVETKHGKYTGSFNLPLVYFSLLQADHPSIAASSLQELNNRKPAAEKLTPQLTDEQLEQKVIDRSVKKSAWALEQLKAIDGLFVKGQKHLLKTKASFAGAFGYPQFIPSTYADYAVSVNQGEPDLFNMRDAILSVAHYLKAKGGWDEKNPQAKSDALFEYNRSRDYGAVILKIAAELQHKS